MNFLRRKSSSKATFKPVRAQSNAKRSTLSNLTKRTLGSGNLRLAVQCPDGEDRFEWWAANTVDFFNEISLLYGLCSEDAQRFTRPGEGFPPCCEYRWGESSGGKTIKAIRVSSPEYVDYVMTWVQDQFDNEEIFPVLESQPFPDDFEDYLRDIYKRLFRIFAIIYHCHFDCIEKLDAAAHLNTTFKHFVFFSVFEFGLINEKELTVLAGPISRLRKSWESQA